MSHRIAHINHTTVVNVCRMIADDFTTGNLNPNWFRTHGCHITAWCTGVVGGTWSIYLGVNRPPVYYFSPVKQNLHSATDSDAVDGTWNVLVDRSNIKQHEQQEQQTEAVSFAKFNAATS